MINEEKKIKIPKKGGLLKARKKLKEMIREEPSPELVAIIEEVTNKKEKSDQNGNIKDIAARPHSSEIGI